MELKEIEEYILFILVALIVKCHTRAPSRHGRGSYFAGGEPYVKTFDRGSSFRSGSPYFSYLETYSPNGEVKQYQFSGQNPPGPSYPQVAPVKQDQTGSPYSSYPGTYSPNKKFKKSQFSGQKPRGPSYPKVAPVNQDQSGSPYSSYPGTYSPNEELKKSQFSGQNPRGPSYPKVAPVNQDQTKSPYSSYPGTNSPNEEFKQSQFSGQNPGGQSNIKVSPVNQEFNMYDRFPSGDKGSESVNSGSEYFRPNAPTLSAQASPQNYQSGYSPNNRQPNINLNPVVGYPSPHYPSKNQVESSIIYIFCDPSLAQRWYSIGDYRDDVNMNKYSPPPFEMTTHKVTDDQKMGHDLEWGEALYLNEISKLGAQDRFGFWDSPTKMFINDHNLDGI